MHFGLFETKQTPRSVLQKTVSWTYGASFASLSDQPNPRPITAQHLLWGFPCFSGQPVTTKQFYLHSTKIDGYRRKNPNAWSILSLLSVRNFKNQQPAEMLHFSVISGLARAHYHLSMVYIYQLTKLVWMKIIKHGGQRCQTTNPLLLNPYFYVTSGLFLWTRKILLFHSVTFPSHA